MLESKFTLSSVARVGLSQDGMAITRDDLAGLESGPDIILDFLIRRFLANLGLHLAKPDKNLLVGKTVKRASKTVESGTISEEGIGESGTDKFAGVSGDITTLMITGCKVSGMTRRGP